MSSAADRAPESDLAGRAALELRCGKLDHDREHAERMSAAPAQDVDGAARCAEAAGGGGVGKLRERPRHRLAIRDDAEELLEIDVEGILSRTREHLHPARASQHRGDLSADRWGDVG